MEENIIYPVCITLSSTLDGEKANHNYIGEYKKRNGTHTIVFNDCTGNMITKVGIEASENAMLIHRVGAFEGDMLFDPESDTSVRYGTLFLKHAFLLHTVRYELKESPDGLSIYVEYIMTDNSNEPGICACQELTVTKAEDTAPRRYLRENR